MYRGFAGSASSFASQPHLFSVLFAVALAALTPALGAFPRGSRNSSGWQRCSRAGRIGGEQRQAARFNRLRCGRDTGSTACHPLKLLGFTTPLALVPMEPRAGEVVNRNGECGYRLIL